MGRYFYIFIFLISCNVSIAQNLIYNGSFEIHTAIPKWAGQIRNAMGWFRPTRGTPDYFSELSGKRPIGAPYNFIGFQKPRTGVAYAGLYLYESSDVNGYREYFSTKLKSPLEKGKQYQVKFYICLSNFSEMAVSNVDVLFTPEAINQYGSERLRNKPQLRYLGDIITDTANWVEMRWTYTAKGNELYLTIGNFEKADKCIVEVMVHGLASGISLNAYYYIDDVCIERIKQDTVCKCLQDTIQPPKVVVNKDSIRAARKPPKLNIEPEESIIIQHISFETNKSDLLPVSYNELNQLVLYMKKHLSATIDFSGYSDNTGRESKNLKLSNDRAKAVADYVQKKGIAIKRIIYKGYGSSSPISDNKTKEGKAKNRRVEFIVHLN